MLKSYPQQYLWKIQLQIWWDLQYMVLILAGIPLALQ